MIGSGVRPGDPAFPGRNTEPAARSLAEAEMMTVASRSSANHPGKTFPATPSCGKPFRPGGAHRPVPADRGLVPGAPGAGRSSSRWAATSESRGRGPAARWMLDRGWHGHRYVQ